jgi:predicted DNA binding protein
MAVAVVSVSTEGFALRRFFERFPEGRIRAQPVVPAGTDVEPLFWTVGTDPAEAEELLRADPSIARVTALRRADERTLFAVELGPDLRRLVELIVDNDGTLLEAEGDADSWRFRVHFPDRSDLAAFRAACRADGVDVGVDRLTDSSPPKEESLLTDAQREALVAAHEMGYWTVPRETTLDELADRLDISPQATSERIRRGIGRVVGAYVAPEEDREGAPG